MWEDIWNFKERCQGRLTRKRSSESRLSKHTMKLSGGKVFQAEGTAKCLLSNVREKQGASVSGGVSEGVSERNVEDKPGLWGPF